MAFRVSPGVSIKEVDLTTIVPAVATTPGGFAGYFHWGPVEQMVTVTNEKELADIFGKPTNTNFVDFYTPANFLSYGNNCQVVRVVGSTAANSQATKAGVTAYLSVTFNNEVQFNQVNSSYTDAQFAGKYPGVRGNSIKVVLTTGTGICGGQTLAAAAPLGATFINMQLNSASDLRYLAVGDDIIFHDGTTITIGGVQKATGGATPTATVQPVFGDFFGVTSGMSGVGVGTALRLVIDGYLPVAQAVGMTFSIKSRYAKLVSTNSQTTANVADSGGANDLINVLVLDRDGSWTGTQNQVLEKFEALSRATDATKTDGGSNYYRTVLNEQSNYVWAVSADVNDNIGGNKTRTGWTLPGVGLSTASAVGHLVSSIGLTGGADAAPDNARRWQKGWSMFADSDGVDVSLLPLGDADEVLSALVIQNVCERRLDCMAFASPKKTNVENKMPYEALNEIKNYRNNSLNINSSYAVLDSGWKYQLDTYNNIVRALPLNGDIAGLVARTEFTNDAWFSPAGYNRGQIKNVVKLLYNPSAEAHRDELYTAQVNPVVSFPGDGVILFGDKTMQTRPSSFDRINVRRLFIVLEKAIATAAKFFLFEQNDAFTRAQFKNLVVPFLKTVQQRRGITDFKVVCDETNNTGEVIDRNEFVADIFVKPTRSINFIQLNFVATKTGVNFSEVGG